MPKPTNPLKYELLPLSLLAASWIAVFVMLPHLPDPMIIHWAADGHPDGWAPRAQSAFVLPIASTFTYLLLSATLWLLSAIGTLATRVLHLKPRRSSIATPAGNAVGKSVILGLLLVLELVIFHAAGSPTRHFPL